MPCANLGMAISPIAKAKHSPMMEMFYTFSVEGPATNRKKGDDCRVRFGRHVQASGAYCAFSEDLGLTTG